MLAGLGAIIYKEVIQVRRDPATRIIFVIPVIQLIVFGYALDLEVRDVSTVVFDADRRSAGREFLHRFESTDVFKITEEATDAAGVRQAIVAGRAKVGIIIPPRFSDDLVAGRSPQVQVLIDGSDNTVASQALAAANGIALAMAPSQQPQKAQAPPIDMRPKVLFNENMLSANFFVPGLVGIILQLTTVFLTAFSIVRERERGTMEQLMVSPVSRWALMLGKVVPFAVIGSLVTLMVLALMVFLFGVPIEGNKFLLLSLSALFLVPSLGLGILISTMARTQFEAMQMGFLIMMPSILLSGFVFPREQMPLLIWLISCLIPVTYYVEILRGIILRGAGARETWQPAAVLAVFAVVIFVASTLRFHKRLE
jgi:drug efflux transport system permease protein/drug efflux transport system ATP-binding protein